MAGLETTKTLQDWERHPNREFEFGPAAELYRGVAVPNHQV